MERLLVVNYLLPALALVSLFILLVKNILSTGEDKLSISQVILIILAIFSIAGFYFVSFWLLFSPAIKSWMAVFPGI